MFKKLMSVTLAIALAAGAMLTTVEPADARNRGGALAAGVVLGVIGATALSAHARSQPRYYAAPACYQGPRECHWTGRSCWYNRFGEYVCGGGQYRCHRPTICP